MINILAGIIATFLRVLMRHLSVLTGTTWLLPIVLITCFPTTGSAVRGYESYLYYLTTVPDQADTSYAGNVQGLAHDKDNWFISQEWGLWKVPVSVDLAGGLGCGTPGVICADLAPVNLFNHLGGIDHYQYDSSTGFLLLSLEHKDRTVPPSLGIFNPTTLQYITYATLQLPPPMAQPTNMPWVAVDPMGQVYTSTEGEPGWIFVYSVDWQKLAQTSSLSLLFKEKFQIHDQSGAPLLIGGQGAAFSESGDLLYINNGYFGNYDANKDGISVIDMATKRRITKSTTENMQLFWYGYNPACDPPFESNCEEPEGLTVWDLDDGRAPNIYGQLHVLLLDNDINDDVFIRHYSNRFYIDASATTLGSGRLHDPFSTLGNANLFLWDGSEIVLQAGNYNEAVTITKKTRLVARGGRVVIGRP